MARHQPLFLERSSYRRRRLSDVARILPVLALVLILLPVWWVPAVVSLTGGALWLFGLWAGLIALTAGLFAAMGTADPSAQSAGQDGGADGDDPGEGAGAGRGRSESAGR
ncbi:hypothetical protein [Paracoccus sp. M683]|uniref:hypothetical protein n=1 Tax=Paracoccus sp. M683 TaxID=2594268 RepID=UPI00163D6294|nr:hypothetical protein [Paracoccus sp. M683]